MWMKMKTSMEHKDHEEKPHRRVSINTEYLNTLRTQSYAEFFTKAQFFVSDTPSSSPKAAELLLEPEQDSIPSLLECLSSPTSLSGLKLLMLNYFDTSAEASRMCTQLLRSINAGHDTYRFIHTSLEAFSSSSPNELSSVISKLNSFTQFNNPFANPSQQDFKLIREEYASILQHLKTKSKQVRRRTKVTEYSKKAAGVCLTAACAVLAVAAVAIAIHSLSGLVVAPALMGVFPGKKRWKNMKLFRSRCRGLRRAGEQIDAAAKGTYILNRDFDTMSRLVDRLHDEVERIKGMIRFWVEREDTFSLQEIVKELRRSGRGLKKQVEELEEQVCLCLVTINRARLSVIEEISQRKSTS